APPARSRCGFELGGTGRAGAALWSAPIATVLLAVSLPALVRGESPAPADVSGRGTPGRGAFAGARWSAEPIVFHHPSAYRTAQAGLVVFRYPTAEPTPRTARCRFLSHCQAARLRCGFTARAIRSAGRHCHWNQR